MSRSACGRPGRISATELLQVQHWNLWAALGKEMARTSRRFEKSLDSLSRWWRSRHGTRVNSSSSCAMPTASVWPQRSQLSDEEVLRLAAQPYRFPGVEINAQLQHS